MKSNSSSSSTSGRTSKFRRDAAIFSPSYPPASTMAAASASAAAAAAAASPPPPMNYIPPNDYPYMYGGYNPYMMYAPQYDYNGYMQMQYMPPAAAAAQYPYGAMPLNGAAVGMYGANGPPFPGQQQMNMPNGPGGYQKYMGPGKSNAKPPSTSKSFKSDSSKPKYDNITPNLSDKSRDNTTSPLSNVESTTTTDSIYTIVKEGNDPIKPSSSETSLEEPIDSHIKYPIYINFDKEEFINTNESRTNQRIQSVNNKQDKLNNYTLEKDIVVNKLPHGIIKDYNTNTTTNFNETNELPKSNDSKSGTGAASNWASIVESSAPPSTTTHKRTKSKVNPPVVANTTNETVKKVPSLDDSSSQPMGILSLLAMYDPKFSILQSDSKFPHFNIIPRGLTNTGNICYMNTILQILLYNEPLNKLFTLIDEKSLGSLNQESKTPLIDNVINLFKEFSTDNSSSNVKSLSPENFYMKLIANEKFNHLKWGQQEDAEEFLGYLLDGLHEEFIHCIQELTPSQINSLIEKFDVESNSTKNEFSLSIKQAIKLVKKTNTNEENSENNDNGDEEDEEDDGDGWSEVGSNSKNVSAKRTVEIEPSPIKTIFGGRFRSVLQIPKQKENQSITLDPFQCLQLDITDDSITDIEGAFKHLNEPEEIPFKSSQNKDVIAKKQTFIDQLPNVLIIHLKRFSFQNNTSDGGSSYEYSSGGIAKLKKKIDYNHKLTVPNECFSNIIRKQPGFNRDYQLTGVVYHHGTGAEGGHYTCDVLKKSSISEMNEEEPVNDQWIRIDDTQITKIKPSDVLTGGSEESGKNAYILFYQKI